MVGAPDRTLTPALSPGERVATRRPGEGLNERSTDFAIVLTGRAPATRAPGDPVADPGPRP